MPRRIDEVDAVTVPFAGHGRGEDGDPTVTLLGVEVGDGRSVVHFPTFVGGSVDIQDPFGDRGLAGVNVGEDAQVADAAQGAGGNTVHAGTHGSGTFRGDQGQDSAIPATSQLPDATAKPGTPVRRAGQQARFSGSARSSDGRAAGAGHPETPESPHTATRGRRQQRDYARPAPLVRHGALRRTAAPGWCRD